MILLPFYLIIDKFTLILKLTTQNWFSELKFVVFECPGEGKHNIILH